MSGDLARLVGNLRQRESVRSG